MKRAVTLLLVLLALAAAAVWALNRRDESPLTQASWQPTAEQIQRGAYLAKAGNCAACHTARGGAPFAGGSGIATPFGTVYTSNLTPDRSGLGDWTPAEFWRALHNGRSRDGHLLYPAFPYPSYTQVTRDDSDALFAYLRSLPAVAQPNRPHALRFPYDSQAALAVWRALYFKPGSYVPDAKQDAEWNRGAYLVRGLGHCIACHGARNRLGATSESVELSGGLIPMQNWYAPSLGDPGEAGVAHWPKQDVVDLLRTGINAQGASVMGPMAEVVFRSTQHLNPADLQAMATFLQRLPQARTAAPEPGPRDRRLIERGGELYKQHCASCHGDGGEGAAGAYPPLKGNRAVTMDPPANLVRVVINGAFAPATAGNPRPYGMPPYVHVLEDHDIAAVLSFIRNAWGNQAGTVSELQVLQFKQGQE
jgi:mono/diheme cytochrome c family protein